MRRLAVLLLLVLPHGASRGLEREAFEVYHQRRRAVSEAHPDGLILLLGYERQEAQAVRSPFRQENNFYYLTGWNEPGAALLLIPAQGDGSVYGELLFLPPDDPSYEKWHGPRAAPDDADIRSQTGFESVLPISKLATRLSRAAKKRSHIYTLFPHRAGEGKQPEPDRREKLQAHAGEFPIADIRAQLEEMRAVKSEGEIRLIQKAVDASIAAHIEAWRRNRSGPVRIPDPGADACRDDRSRLPADRVCADHRQRTELDRTALHGRQAAAGTGRGRRDGRRG